MPDPVSLRFALPFAALAAAGLLAVGWAISRFLRGQELVAFEPRRAVPWNGWHVLGVLGLWVLFQLGVKEYAAATALALDPVRALALLSAGNVMFVCTAVVGLKSIGATWADLGLRVDKLGRDVLYGAVAFFVSLVPVYGLMLLLGALFPDQEPHPVVTLLREHASLVTLAVCAISVVIVAPLAEEVLFRIVFQGWLERVAAQRWTERLCTEPPVCQTPPPAQIHGNTRPSDLASPEASLDDNPYKSPRADVVAPPVPEARRLETTWQPAMVAPIVISSFCFAAVHPHGLAPFPLFLLALVLGYVYQRTHRILAPIVLHACLNACSLGLLWLQVA